MSSDFTPDRPRFYFSALPDRVHLATQDVATLQPRPPAIIEEPPARGFRGYKPLAVFLLCNALPLAAAVWSARWQGDGCFASSPGTYGVSFPFII